MTNSSKPALSSLENRVMRIVWQRGRATAEEVRGALQSTRPLKDSTVRTVLRRLQQKGYVEHQLQGRTYIYSPTVPSRSVAAEAVRAIIQRLCNGSLEDLLLGMVDREVVSPEKLRELAERIAEGEKPGPASGKKRRRSPNSKQG